jgi:hypothetical protein
MSISNTVISSLSYFVTAGSSAGILTSLFPREGVTPVRAGLIVGGMFGSLGIIENVVNTVFREMNIKLSKENQAALTVTVVLLVFAGVPFAANLSAWTAASIIAFGILGIVCLERLKNMANQTP